MSFYFSLFVVFKPVLTYEYFEKYVGTVTDSKSIISIFERMLGVGNHKWTKDHVLILPKICTDLTFLL